MSSAMITKNITKRTAINIFYRGDAEAQRRPFCRLYAFSASQRLVIFFAFILLDSPDRMDYYCP